MTLKPILVDLPVPITTPRLFLRPPQLGDGKTVHKAILESLDVLQAWMPWAQTSTTVENVEEYGRLGAANWTLRSELDLRLWDRSTSEYVGAASFHDINWRVPCLEIGYWIRTSRSGSGLMTEAVNALTRYAFDVIKAKRVEIRCDKDNVKSRQIPERLGFKLDVIFEKNETKVDGSARDTAVYSRLDKNGLPKLEVSW